MLGADDGCRLRLLLSNMVGLEEGNALLLLEFEEGCPPVGCVLGDVDAVSGCNEGMCEGSILGKRDGGVDCIKVGTPVGEVVN
jgi:hypothetical protein